MTYNVENILKIMEEVHVFDIRDTISKVKYSTDIISMLFRVAFQLH